jgi:hypothetical protein
MYLTKLTLKEVSFAIILSQAALCILFMALLIHSSMVCI